MGAPFMGKTTSQRLNNAGHSRLDCTEEMQRLLHRARNKYISDQLNVSGQEEPQKVQL